MPTQHVKVELIALDVRSAHNVGSFFRTSDAVGVSKIYLVGTTPTPVDRFGRARKDISKVALGAEKVVNFEYKKNVKPLFKTLKENGYEIVALEQSDKSIDYQKYRPQNNKVALVVGSEVGGIKKEVLSLCDKIIEIPMRGVKESLNVSVATGVALYQIVTSTPKTKHTYRQNPK